MNSPPDRPSPPRRRATLKDVAAALGVSPMTVSLSLRGDTQIPPATRERVRAAADLLHYVPMASGRLLKSGRSGRIAILASRIAHAFVGQVLAGVEQRTFELGRYHNAILPFSTWSRSAEKDKALNEIVYGGLADALIMVSMHPDPAMVRSMAEHGMPLVLIEDRVRGCHSVRVDNVQGAAAAARRLIETGCRNIALVVGELPKPGLEPNPTAVERREGFAAAFKAARRRQDPDLLVDIGFYTFEEGRAALDTLLDRCPRLDGVFCAAGDRVAMGLMERARERGLAIPGDLKVIGYDDLQGSQLLSPPLTTVRQPVEQMGAEALELAVQALDGLLPRERHIMHQPTLVVRGTA